VTSELDPSAQATILKLVARAEDRDEDHAAAGRFDSATMHYKTQLGLLTPPDPPRTTSTSSAIASRRAWASPAQPPSDGPILLTLDGSQGEGADRSSHGARLPS